MKHLLSVFFMGLGLALITLLIVSGCSVEEPQVPTVTKRVTVPLYFSVFNSDSLVDQSEYLGIKDGLVHFSFADTVDETSLGDELELEDFEEGTFFGLEEITLDPPGDVETEEDVSLIEIDPSLSDMIGEMIVLDPAPIERENLDLEEYASFLNIDIQTAEGVEINLDNDLIIPIDSLEVDIYTIGPDGLRSDEPIESVRFDDVGSNERGTIVIDLSERSITNRLVMDVRGSTAGSNGEPVLIEDTAFRLGVNIGEEIAISSGVADVPEQRIMETKRVLWEDETRARNAIVERGELVLNLRNELPVGSADSITITLPNFRDGSGNELVQRIDIDANSEEIVPINIAGFRVENPENEEATVDSIIISMDITTESGEAIEIDVSDLITIEIEVNDIRFTMVEGILSPRAIGPKESISEDLFGEEGIKGMNEVDLPEMEAYLNLLSDAASLPVRVELLLESRDFASVTDDNPEIRTLMVTQDIILTTEHDGLNNRVQLIGDDGTRFAEFFNNFPDELISTTTLIVGSTDIPVSITGDDSILAVIEIEMPAVFQFPDNEDLNRIEVVNELEEIDIEDEIRNAINRGEVVEANGKLLVVNGFPAGVIPEIYFGTANDASVYDVNSSQHLLLLPKPVNGQQQRIDAGEVNQDGYVINPTLDVLNVDLTQDDIELFGDHPTIYVGGVVKVLGTDGIVRLTESDSVKVYFNMELEMKLTEDLTDDF